MRKKPFVLGVGINDSEHPTKINKKAIPAYEAWHSILVRCYSEKSFKKRPTYIKCEICEEWKSFSAFEKWYDSNKINGFVIDKDILFIGNTVYSPSTCRFVPPNINTLLLDRRNDRGEYPIGVSEDNYGNKKKKYKACISKYGRNVHLGYFSTPEEAHEAWRLAKIEYVGEVARAYLFSGEISEEVFDALISRDFR